MSPSVLVLNATYEPLNVVSLRRAIVLLLKDKAEVVESTERYIRARGLSLPEPQVIRLVYYVRVPYALNVPLSRRTIMLRDDYTCQYCGEMLTRDEATVDHVLPKSRGGVTAWDNVVCACQSCNARKGSRTLAEAGMVLLQPPSRPKYLALVLLVESHDNHGWEKYITRAHAS
ncbi:MAG: HNH endonuclease [Chloroflexi bacterium]|nr:HNH endonuclease [Chloroflexota bacterium]